MALGGPWYQTLIAGFFGPCNATAYRFEGAHVEAIGSQPKEKQRERHLPGNPSLRKVAPARHMKKFLLITK